MTCSNKSCIKYTECIRYEEKQPNKSYTHVEPSDNTKENFKCRYFKKVNILLKD